MAGRPTTGHAGAPAPVIVRYRTMAGAGAPVRAVAVRPGVGPAGRPRRLVVPDPTPPAVAAGPSRTVAAVRTVAADAACDGVPYAVAVARGVVRGRPAGPDAAAWSAADVRAGALHDAARDAATAALHRGTPCAPEFTRGQAVAMALASPATVAAADARTAIGGTASGADDDPMAGDRGFAVAVATVARLSQRYAADDYRDRSRPADTATGATDSGAPPKGLAYCRAQAVARAHDAEVRKDADVAARASAYAAALARYRDPPPAAMPPISRGYIPDRPTCLPASRDATATATADTRTVRDRLVDAARAREAADARAREAADARARYATDPAYRARVDAARRARGWVPQAEADAALAACALAET